MPRVLKVESANQWYQRAEVLLRNRRKRRQHGQFIVEGVRSINQLVARSDWPIEAFLYSRDAELSRWARDVLESSRAVHHLVLAPELMESLSERDDTSELLAIAEIPEEDVKRVRVPRNASGEAQGNASRDAQGNALIVVADRIQSPGNLGTLVRSCDALGADGLVLFGHTADPYDPKAVRSAAGSLFALPVARVESLAALEQWLRDVRDSSPGLKVVGSSARAETRLAATDLTGPIVFMLGGEADGLSENLRGLCDTIANIPMQGAASSLNIASALTVMLYEAATQRAGGRPGR